MPFEKQNEDYDPAQMERGRLFFEKPWTFLLSVAALPQLPAIDTIEIAFAGRSNVGKSSLINALTRTKGLARASNTPGRTQQLNFFMAGDALTLVDMPGYGYAKAPVHIVEEWHKLIEKYLRGRQALRRVYVLIDARHGIKANDIEVMDMLDKTAVSYQVVLTKADKIKQPALIKVIEDTKQKIEKRPAAYYEVIVTSSEKSKGIDTLRTSIIKMMEELS